MSFIKHQCERLRLCRRLDTMGLGPIFNMSAWDSVARQAMIRCAKC